MRSVILCEGSDDLWFIAYFLNKTSGWTIAKQQEWSPYYGLLPSKAVNGCYNRQEVQYMLSADKKNTLAIFSTGGQDRMKSTFLKVIQLNANYPQPGKTIDSIVIFRDCDDHSPDSLAESMKSWFDSVDSWRVSSFSLKNQTPILLENCIEECLIRTIVLPVIIPFDEEGAIETLLLKAIDDSGDEGHFVAESAKKYISDVKSEACVTTYLSHQRLVTKAKYSAAIAITNPDHSTKLFQQLMESTPWEQSAAIKTHMEKVVQLITGQLDLTHTR